MLWRSPCGFSAGPRCQSELVACCEAQSGELEACCEAQSGELEACCVRSGSELACSRQRSKRTSEKTMTR